MRRVSKIELYEILSLRPVKGNRKNLVEIFTKYFEKNREEMKKDPKVQKPTGLCFDYDSFVKNGKVHIVFEGGGMKGYAHLGAFVALMEEGLLPKNTHLFFYGTSAGAVAAVVCSLIAMGKMTPKEAYEKFSIHPAYLVFFYNFPFPLVYNPFNGRLIRWRIDSIMKKKNVKNLSELRTTITTELRDVQRKDCTFLAVFGPKPFVDVPLQKVDEWRYGKNLSIGKIVQASCSIPGFFTSGVVSNAKLSIIESVPPYEQRIPLRKKVLAEPGPPGVVCKYELKGKGLLSDGGTKANLPLLVALSTPRYRKESDIIYAINLEIEKRESRLRGLLNKLQYSNPRSKIIRFIKNTADAFIQSLYLLHPRNNLFSTAKNNINSMMEEIAERGNALCMHGNVVMFTIRVPNVPLFNPTKAPELILEGYKQTKEQIRELKKLAGLI
ncbi:MAG: patatin-like phospholipase family protein [Candidatus Anstonellales archaeon]